MIRATMPQNERALNGKVMVVTGPTSGIGEVTAQELAARGATVVLFCRDRRKGETLRDRLRRETSNDAIDVVVGDFASFAAVRAGAAAVLARHPRIDVLVNNAGAIQLDRTLTADGIETTFATNHLAPFLLTHLLLDRLKASAPSRVVNVASRAHFRRGINLDDPEGKRSYDGMTAYCRSKLENVLFTYELARRLEGTRVTANCLHPGVISSGFGRNTPGVFKVLISIAGPFMWTPKKGAQTSIKLATSSEVEGVTGKYFDERGREVPSSRLSYERELQTRLWEMSERMVGI
jgi:NAD(P)-dependent dehydrogenase (short-subunit alcohol dehydrogenase family)